MGKAVLKVIRNYLLGAIILVGAAIVVGGMTDIVPAVTWEPVVIFFSTLSCCFSPAPLGLHVS
jgi:hypothetical protein